MRSIKKKFLIGVLAMGLTVPLVARAAEQDLQQKIDALSKEVENLKQQVKRTDDKSLGKWLTIGGDYRFRYDYLRGEVPAYTQGYIAPPNSSIAGGYSATWPQMQGVSVPTHTVENKSLYSNRFGLNLKAKATKDVTVTARMLMYKIAGAQDDSSLRDGNTAFSFDRAGLFDGTLGHVPGSSTLAVDQVYATWNNIAGQPIWFSIGRRPSTGGIPTHLKQDNERPGNSGIPGLLVDYAFDGVTLGYAPDITALPGAYAKLCYGRGFQNSITDAASNGLHNTDMIGLNVVPYDTDPLRVELQYNRGLNIFDAPNMQTGPFSFLKPTTNLGDIDWLGLDFLGKIKNVASGDLHWFVSGAMSKTHANDHTLSMTNPYLPAGSPLIATPFGLLYTGTPEDVTGWAIMVGGRYDFNSKRTKLGLEYNHGSQNWIAFAPAADDMWTSKAGTRGDVYEAYLIQELNLAPISSYTSKTFFKIGYQYYNFEYTGSNSWLGAPIKISDLTPMQAQLTAPLKNAQNVYATFEVHF